MKPISFGKLPHEISTPTLKLQNDQEIKIKVTEFEEKEKSPKNQVAELQKNASRVTVNKELILPSVADTGSPNPTPKSMEISLKGGDSPTKQKENSINEESSPKSKSSFRKSEKNSPKSQQNDKEELKTPAKESKTPKTEGTKDEKKNEK
jgi:hypothetical protein